MHSNNYLNKCIYVFLLGVIDIREKITMMSI